MSGKGNVCADEEPEGNRKRKVMSLLEKVEVLDKLESKMRIAAVRCLCGINKLLTHFIKKKATEKKSY
jgi:predicted metal-binding protein